MATEPVTDFRFALSETLKTYPQVSLKDFRVPEDGSDASAAIQSAIDQMYRIGGGVLYLSAATYGLASEIKPKPNVALVGVPGKSRFRVLVDNIQLFGRHGLPKEGGLLVEDIILEGYADRNPTLGNQKLINVNAFESIWFNRCEVRYSRNMGIGAIADSVWVTNCHVHHIHRDGINLTGSTYMRVEDNVINETGDDGVACHVSSASSGVVDGTIVISRNTLRKTFGIKALGARQTIISDNNLRFWGGYGINVGVDTSFGEGYGAKWGITVTGNVLVDGFNVTRFGNGSQNYAIYINGGRSLGTGGSAITTLPGNYDSGSGAFIYPGGMYANKVGSSNPSSEHTGLIVANNSIRQTIEGVGFTKFSDAGYGQLWSNQGYLTDASSGSAITSKGFIFEVNGVQLAGIALSNSVIGGNSLEGVGEAFRISGATDLVRSLSFSNNAVRRCKTGAYLEGDGATGGSIDVLIAVRGNTIDVDPYCEHSGRTTPIDGTWTATDGADGFGVVVRNMRGVIIEGNAILNCRRPVRRIGSAAAVALNNSYIYDWSGATLKGIALVESGTRRGNRFLFMNSDPTSADYGKFSATADSGFVTESAAMPSSGYYAAGQIVENLTPSISGGKVLAGWRRLTTSNNHVLNTDWVGIYEPNS